MKLPLLISGVLFSLAIVFAIWYFLFNVYEVKVIAENNGFARSGGLEIVKVFGVNAFGGKVPFVKIKSKAELIAGSNLVRKILPDEQGFKLRLNKGQGKVKLKIDGEYFLAPAIVEVNVKKPGVRAAASPTLAISKMEKF